MPEILTRSPNKGVTEAVLAKVTSISALYTLVKALRLPIFIGAGVIVP